MRRIVLGEDGGQPITYHNAQELDRGRYGLTLQRVLASWRDRFPEATGWRATQAAGVELRFRAATSEIALDLRTVNHIPGGHSLALYHGFRAVCTHRSALPCISLRSRLSRMKPARESNRR